MVLGYLQTKLSVLPRIFSPTVDAIFSTLPFWQRWRLLCLQPINIIAALLTSKSWFFNDQYKVISVPTRGGKQRCLIFEPNYSGRAKANLRPLHIDIHGGGWIGGMAEQGSRFCTLIANQTGAIVVSITYRIAPRHIYPAAHDDTNDVVRWIIQNAKELGADASMLTIGGSSVGATLALSACQMLHAQRSSPDAGKSCLPLAFMAVCPALDFRVRPREKPRPHNFPTTDPLSFLEPMFDVYAGTNRLENISDPRLHPILMDADMLPKDSMVVAAGIDIVLQEALEFVKRMKSSGRGKNIELFVVEKGFHGFLELPSFILEKERLEVFEKVVVFMDKVYLKAGFDKRDL